ncbi:MAG: hypothetical protein E7Z93_02060 [Cyanobacteria bacterium SIG32]|nr:hypothetical protein [Cyanobacteria bacterium SIG32]
MSKITAVKNSIYRSTHIRKGGGISRTYHNVKNMCRMEAGVAAIEMLLAVNAARRHVLFNTVLMTGLTMYFSKKAVEFYNMRADLHKYYQPIVNRAKQIYKR